MPDIIVSNQAELANALKNAKGGETIKLLSGDYGSLNIYNQNFASAVNIVSADAGNPAVIQRLTISGASNVAFKDIDLALPPSTTESVTQLNYIFNSTNISLEGVHIRGPLDDPRQSNATGMVIKNSTGVSIVDSTMDHMMSGFDITDSSNIVIKNNSLSDIRRDGMIIAGVHGMEIGGNLFTNFHPAAGDHPDAIQFYTHGKAGSGDIKISDNLILQGEGEAAQGIFMSYDGDGGYTNVTVTNNLVYMSGLSNAIFVQGVKNAVVSSNSVLSRTDDSSPAWIVVKDVTGGSVTNNVADALLASNNTALTEGKNTWLGLDGAAVRGLRGINSLAEAKISSLLLERVGFHPAPGTVAYDLLTAEQASGGKTGAALISDHMILDLQFDANGVQDHSLFKSSATTAALNLANIRSVNGESVYHVETGKGFELTRANSLQLFNMTAFTLSFDLQRDSASASTGQVIGINQSWSVTLMSNGELNFTLRNDAGVTYSVVTKDAKITDAKNHEIAITYDKTAQRAVIYVDQVAKGTGKVTGSTRGVEYWSLYVGSPFGTSFSGNVGNIQLRDVALPAAQITLAGGDSTPVALPPVAGTNPFLAGPSMAAASVATLMDYKQYGLQLLHA